jgi:hypothetical protein
VRTVTAPDGLYLRGGKWWCRVFGKRLSTGCRDRDAALIRKAELEATVARDAREEFVYFVRDRGDRVKIGFTSQPHRRWDALRRAVHQETGLDVIAVIPGDRRTERAIHLGFSRFHLGGEWFAAAPALLEFASLQQSVGAGWIR